MSGNEAEQRKFTVINGELGVIAIYRLEVTVGKRGPPEYSGPSNIPTAFVATRFSDSSLSLTLSATLRDTVLQDLPRQIVVEGLRSLESVATTDAIGSMDTSIVPVVGEAHSDALIEINLLDALLDRKSRVLNFPRNSPRSILQHQGAQMRYHSQPLA